MPTRPGLRRVRDDGVILALGKTSGAGYGSRRFRLELAGASEEVERHDTDNDSPREGRPIRRGWRGRGPIAPSQEARLGAWRCEESCSGTA